VRPPVAPSVVAVWVLRRLRSRDEVDAALGDFMGAPAEIAGMTELVRKHTVTV
jgi:hypothetical protein